MQLLIWVAAALAVASGRVADPVAQDIPEIDEAKIDHADCGRRPLALNEQPGQFIVGGSEAKANSWPWMCSLERNQGHICGGSLIKNRAGNFFFITAAHCVTNADFNAGRYRVRCGVHNRHATNEANVQILSLRALYRHPSYSSSTYRYDVAIFALNSNPTQTNAVQAVCLPITHYEDYGSGNTREDCVVTGWGTLYSGGPSPSVLHEVHKPIVSDSVCATAYGTSFHALTMMCAGNYASGGQDACQGDSGGPLVVLRGGVWKLAGVVSWGYGCAQPGYPGVYTDTYNMKTWINDIINVQN